MIIEISLIIIAITQLLLVTSLCVIFFKINKSVKNLNANIEKVSSETVQLLASLNKVVSSDLQAVSNEAADLISKTSELVSDLSYKSRSMNFLFKPFGFLSSGMNKLLPSDPKESEDKKEDIPETVKWLSRGLFLIKLTRRLVKKYGK
jgi:uncharacterized protein YoxC